MDEPIIQMEISPCKSEDTSCPQLLRHYLQLLDELTNRGGFVKIRQIRMTGQRFPFLTINKDSHSQDPGNVAS